MAKQLTVISGNKIGGQYPLPVPDQRLKNFRAVMGVVLDDAQKTWGEIWKEFQGQVTEGVLVLPEAEQGFKPPCGWPEFLEKMWLLKHYLDYAKRFADGEV